jgi:hypothetical protein
MNFTTAAVANRYSNCQYENRNREARDADARWGSKAEKLDLCAAGAPL